MSSPCSVTDRAHIIHHKRKNREWASQVTGASNWEKNKKHISNYCGLTPPFRSSLSPPPFFLKVIICEREVVWWGYAELWRFNPLKLTTYISHTQFFFLWTSHEDNWWQMSVFVQFTVLKNLRNWEERSIKFG